MPRIHVPSMGSMGSVTPVFSHGLALELDDTCQSNYCKYRSRYAAPEGNRGLGLRGLHLFPSFVSE